MPSRWWSEMACATRACTTAASARTPQRSFASTSCTSPRRTTMLSSGQRNGPHSWSRPAWRASRGCWRKWPHRSARYCLPVCTSQLLPMLSSCLLCVVIFLSSLLLCVAHMITPGPAQPGGDQDRAPDMDTDMDAGEPGSGSSAQHGGNAQDSNEAVLVGGSSGFLLVRSRY